MFCRIHTKSGRSFAGLSAYLLHDKGRTDSAHRVAFTETRNIATDDPRVATRIMAATAMSQAELKRAAGVPNTGRKAKGHVMHYTLSWDHEESKDLSREEMMRAVLGSLKVLGSSPSKQYKERQYADEHQALIVCHNDEKHAHVHVALCMVHPETGRMLPTSNDQLKLSRWAQKYEQERGNVLCDARVVHNAARDRGEYVVAPKSKPRHIYELEAAHRDHPDRERIAAQERAKDIALAKKTEALNLRKAKARRELEDRYTASRRSIAEETRRQKLTARKAIQDRYRRDHWAPLQLEQDAEMQAFRRDETRLTGRVKNALGLIDYRAIFASEDRRTALRDAFGVLASGGLRLQKLCERQQAQIRTLEGRQNAEVRRAWVELAANKRQQLRQRHRAYTLESKTLTLAERMDEAALRASWKERRLQRLAAWEIGRPRDESGREASPTADQARGEQTTKADDRTRDLVDGFKKQMERRRRTRKRDRDRDDGRGL